MKPFAFLATFFALYLLPCRAARAADLQPPASTLAQASPHLSPEPCKAPAPPSLSLAPPPALPGACRSFIRLASPASPPRAGARKRIFRSGLSPPV